ncbi:hypothetical protein [Rhizomicrobium electricum]|jgi:hypothetical protein|uniref:PRC-barrel domain-containing protein n=1 Tax=Rhizomicrobium electricum TaxID=480070 RepID=A0ABN1EKJ0_9PROT|nr:hypothetical protein [Rhizomicrobium electricum]NIJ47159.1 hypothetical protein [Rhizomicrobium electricum]
MRVATTFFVTTMLLGGVAWAGNAAAMKQAANAPRAASTAKTVDISEVVNPSDTLSEAKVEDAQGKPIGEVQRVVTSDSGLVGRLEVQLKSPQKVVALTPAQVRYVPFNGKLRTTMTADQVVSLPAAKGQ